MTLTENMFAVRRALSGISAIGQAAVNSVHITRATKILVLDARLRGALSLGPRLGMASSMMANNGRTNLAIASSHRPDSSIDDEPTKPGGARHRHNPSTPSKSDSSFPNLKILLGIFVSAYRSLVVSPSPDRQTHQKNPVNHDKIETSPLADAKQSVRGLLGQLAAPFEPAFKRVLVRGTQIVNEMATFLKNKATVPSLMRWGVYALSAQWLLGWAVDFIKSIVIRPFQEGFRVMQSGLLGVRWLLSKVAPAALIRLGKLFSKAVEFGASLFDIPLASYLVVGGIVAAVVKLAVAGYELYRHWDAAKRLLSRSIESAHRAVANFRKWLADRTRKAAAHTGNSIAGITATLSNAPHLLTDAAPAMRGPNGARAVERAAAGMRPARLRAIRQVAAAAAFAAPLMLATAPAGAFAPPLISTSDIARTAASQSAPFTTQGPIVINYAPNVTIHSEGAADTDALKRRVMEILERHGHELHQVLQREMVRQQRRDFQPRYSHEQG